MRPLYALDSPTANPAQEELLMKKILFSLMMLSPIALIGDQFLDDVLSYGFESGSKTKVYVSGRRDTSATEITVPATVVYEYQEKNSDGNYVTKHRTCKVTRIGRRAFFYQSNVKSVAIPDGVTSIDKEAFFHCYDLTNVELPNSVTNIGQDAFCWCLSLPSITLPERLHSIEYGAFLRCESLMSVDIPDGVKSIGPFAFTGCIRMTSVTIPNSVSGIGYDAFQRCGIKSVIIPNDWTNIVDELFVECSSLTNVVIPSRVESIGIQAFGYCSNLEDVLIPNSVKTIGKRALCECVKLKRLVIPSSVKSIGIEAFYDCRNVSVFSFDGLPPSVGSSAFAGVKSGAIGTYKKAYRAQWQAVIDANGKWNGLIMQEINSPVVSVSEASIPYDTLKLRWSYVCNDEVEFSLYRNTAECLADATLIVSGEEAASGTYTESDFMKIAPQTSSLHYWIVAENKRTGERIDAHVEARRRFLMSVGYSAYGQSGANAMVQSYRDALYFRSRCVLLGGFLSQNTSFRYNANATTQKIRDAMKDYAERAQPGDLFVFYIATHGNDFYTEALADWIEDMDVFDWFRSYTSALVTYDGVYILGALLTDVQRFSAGVAVCGIIMSCHSQSLIGGVSGRNWVDKWLANCGFGQCLGNVAWITSCSTLQNSYNSSTYTMFGQAFIVDGLAGGYADGTLFGASYAGGNGDGNITLDELGLYAREFARGYSDEKPSTVQLENRELLGRIIVVDKAAGGAYSRPGRSTDVSVGKGRYISKIPVTWDPVANATEYMVYRTPVGSIGARKWIGRTIGQNSTSFEDSSVMLLRSEYDYQVQAVNPVGFGELSAATTGWRGTPDYVELIDSIYRKLISVSESSVDVSYADKENTIAANGYSLGDSYVAGLDPTNEMSKFSANIIMSNDVPIIVWSPDLGSNRTYTIYGKSDLTDAEWFTPTNSAHRFFKVGVKLAE